MWLADEASNMVCSETTNCDARGVFGGCIYLDKLKWPDWERR